LRPPSRLDRTISVQPQTDAQCAPSLPDAALVQTCKFSGQIVLLFRRLVNSLSLGFPGSPVGIHAVPLPSPAVTPRREKAASVCIWPEEQNDSYHLLLYHLRTVGSWVTNPGGTTRMAKDLPVMTNTYCMLNPYSLLWHGTSRILARHHKNKSYRLRQSRGKVGGKVSGSRDKDSS